jgi:hypothetical protein
VKLAHYSAPLVNRFVSFPEIIWEYAWPTSRDGAILVRRAKVLVVQSLFGRSRVVACVDSQILTVLLFWCFGVEGRRSDHLRDDCGDCFRLRSCDCGVEFKPPHLHFQGSKFSPIRYLSTTRLLATLYAIFVNELNRVQLNTEEAKATFLTCRSSRTSPH